MKDNQTKKLPRTPQNTRPHQEDYYLQVEADAYFKRNLPAMAQKGPETSGSRQALSGGLRLIELTQRASIKPRSMVDIGGSNGYFTSAFQKTFGCKATLIEPSKKAIAYASKNYPNIKSIRGVASKLPLADNSVDVVVIKGVLCWIGRESILKAVAEIDRVLTDGGHLLISDFHPDSPRKTLNRHAADADIYCFKTDHSKIFLDSGLYSVIASEVFIDENDYLKGGDIYDFRHQNVVLRKSYLNYYQTRGGK